MAQPLTQLQVLLLQSATKEAEGHIRQSVSLHPEFKVRMLVYLANITPAGGQYKVSHHGSYKDWLSVTRANRQRATRVHHTISAHDEQKILVAYEIVVGVEHIHTEEYLVG
jgi:hypothetical protein